ncbi:MAG: UDP-N-acetylmuramate--L-alanine ligase [Alphaproteobacteria bacterium]
MKLHAETLIKKNIGNIHFIGIGGIGMSGIAEILHNLGYSVQGSDTSDNYNMERLKKLGIKVFYSHSSENIKDAAVVVKSSAIKSTNSEIIAARERKIPVVKRSEMLAELMRFKFSIAIAGTHGKTTTTSLAAIMFEAAGLNPTVINGGIINSRGTNAYLGSGDYLIAEADESDATFIKIPSTIGIITNIDPEHLDFYGNFDALKAAFHSFIENLPFYGFGVLCIDHPEVKNLSKKISDRKIITYGIDSDDADIKAINIKQEINGSTYDVVISERIANGRERLIKNLYLPTPGLHNVLNSLSIIAVAIELKFEYSVITTGFKEFKGVKRRFTQVAEINGIRIIDDYAHHPTEISATLKTAKTVLKNSKNKIIAIAQPHRYSRVHDLFSEFAHCFSDADNIIIADIYPAGEEPIEGINKNILAATIKKANPKKEVRPLDNLENLPYIINSIAKEGDIVIFLGAGNITDWAYALPGQMKDLNL